MRNIKTRQSDSRIDQQKSMFRRFVAGISAVLCAAAFTATAAMQTASASEESRATDTSITITQATPTSTYNRNIANVQLGHSFSELQRIYLGMSKATVNVVKLAEGEEFNYDKHSNSPLFESVTYNSNNKTVTLRDSNEPIKKGDKLVVYIAILGNENMFLKEVHSNPYTVGELKVLHADLEKKIIAPDSGDPVLLLHDENLSLDKGLQVHVTDPKGIEHKIEKPVQSQFEKGFSKLTVIIEDLYKEGGYGIYAIRLSQSGYADTTTQLHLAERMKPIKLVPEGHSVDWNAGNFTVTTDPRARLLILFVNDIKTQDNAAVEIEQQHITGDNVTYKVDFSSYKEQIKDKKFVKISGRVSGKVSYQDPTVFQLAGTPQAEGEHNGQDSGSPMPGAPDTEAPGKPGEANGSEADKPKGEGESMPQNPPADQENSSQGGPQSGGTEHQAGPEAGKSEQPGSPTPGDSGAPQSDGAESGSKPDMQSNEQQDGQGGNQQPPAQPQQPTPGGDVKPGETGQQTPPAAAEPGQGAPNVPVPGAKPDAAGSTKPGAPAPGGAETVKPSPAPKPQPMPQPQPQPAPGPAVPGKKSPGVKAGQQREVVIEQDNAKPFEVTFAGNYADLLDYSVDGQPVTAEQVQVRSGSTIFTFSPEYLQSLSAGEHTLTAVYKESKEFAGGAYKFKFTVHKAEAKITADVKKTENGKQQGLADTGATVFVPVMLAVMLTAAGLVVARTRKVSL